MLFIIQNGDRLLKNAIPGTDTMLSRHVLLQIFIDIKKQKLVECMCRITQFNVMRITDVTSFEIFTQTAFGRLVCLHYICKV